MPEFSLPKSGGGTLGSADMTGKKYVVYFYPRDFTPGCTTEADEFAKSYGTFQEAGIDVIGVSPDTSKSHEKFCAKMDIPFALLSDADKTMAQSFGVWGSKKFMGREYMGVKRSTFLVDEKGTICKIFRNVRPKGHASQVLESFYKIK